MSAAVIAAASAAARAAEDAIEAPLTAVPGDAARGRAIVASRSTGLCLLCHRGPLADPHLQGTLAPDLAGVGARLTAAQLRLRLVDPARLNPETIMPSYLRTEGLARVAHERRGRPVLSPQQVEDVIAYLATLR